MAKKTRDEKLPKGIYERTTADGRTRYVAMRTYRAGNKRVTLKATSTLLKDAKADLKKLDEQVRAIQRGEISADRPSTLHELVNEYERERAVEAKYNAQGFRQSGLRRAKNYRPLLAAIRDYFPATMKLESLTPIDVENYAVAIAEKPVTFKHWRTEMAIDGEKTKAMVESRDDDGNIKSRPRSVASVRRHLAVLSTVLVYAERKKYISPARNPFRAAVLPAAFSIGAETEDAHARAEAAGKKRVLTDDEVRRLLTACDNDDRRHLRVILIALLDTGRRISEVLQWQWRNVDLEKRTVAIERQTTKTRRKDVIYIGVRLTAALAAIRPAKLPAGSAEAVFVYVPRGEERPRPVKSIKRSFASACAAAGLTGVTPHALRHHVGSRLGALNVPAAAVQARLGHARLETTLGYYMHETEAGKHLAADEVDKMIVEAERVN